MRPRPWLASACLALTVAGCAGGWAGQGARPVPGAGEALLSDSEIAAGHLELMSRVAAAPESEQDGIFESVRDIYLEAPSPSRRLRYACLLATHGHRSSDPAAGRSLLDDLIATPAGLGSAQLALARVVRQEVDARLSLMAALNEARALTGTEESDRAASASRRIQAQAAEITRLRKELDEAQAKLEAIAELERSLVKRPVPNGDRP